MYEIVKNYRNDEHLRRSFNALAEKTFGLNFENWYQLGYWGDNYNPYSLVMDGEVVANVSLNRTDMVIGGERKRVYQLGTVMTAEEHRNKGFIRAIMAEIEKDTADADGVYLFGNDNVVEFYPKFGFVPDREFVWERDVAQKGPCTMARVMMDSAENRDRFAAAMAESTFPAACHMVDNPGLIFFYVAQFMQDCVYYSEALDAWAIAEIEDGEMTLHNVFSTRDISLDEVIAAFGTEVRHVTLGFSPADTAGFTCREWKEEDCNFFTKGPAFAGFTQKKLRIPTLSHA
ncbi:MAG: GNAT family N-acetyltransferase [Oscillospiraceae bacterium]|nr:GNAT family N-acetyltransferase [Oscillospiraceae bacterium]